MAHVKIIFLIFCNQSLWILFYLIHYYDIRGFIWFRSNWSIALFKVCVSLLIFCWVDLSISVSGVLKSPTIIKWVKQKLIEIDAEWPLIGFSWGILQSSYQRTWKTRKQTVLYRIPSPNSGYPLRYSLEGTVRNIHLPVFTWKRPICLHQKLLPEGQIYLAYE